MGNNFDTSFNNDSNRLRVSLASKIISTFSKKYSEFLILMTCKEAEINLILASLPEASSVFYIQAT